MMELDRIVSSDLIRVFVIAQIMVRVYSGELVVILESRFRELYFGDLDGILVS